MPKYHMPEADFPPIARPEGGFPWEQRVTEDPARAERTRQDLLNRLEAEEALARWKEDHGYLS